MPKTVILGAARTPVSELDLRKPGLGGLLGEL